MEWVKATIRALAKDLRTPRSAERCCVPGCSASLLVTVASRQSMKTMMCLGHAHEWVDSDGCWRIAEDATGGIEEKLEAWTQACRRSATSLQPRLRAV